MYSFVSVVYMLNTWACYVNIAYSIYWNKRLSVWPGQAEAQLNLSMVLCPGFLGLCGQRKHPRHDFHEILLWIQLGKMNTSIK